MDRSNNAVDPAISLQSISKFFADTTVIDNISLDLAEGEFLSLLGPSGSGKTTILRMVAGLASPSEGKVILKGQDVSAIPPNKRNLGMVFQQYALFPHMTVWDNVAYGLRARKEKADVIKQKVEKYLELVGLSHLAKRKPRELSGGQQQRVSLARALTVEPVVMLFDEPLSNLDVRLKEQMLQEIRNLHQTIGFSAIYVTHDQNEALYLSDKIAVLNKGKIEQFAAPEAILKQPASAFVADFFGYTNRGEGAVLLEEGKARLGNCEIPVGHVGADAAPGDRGVLLMRANAIQIADYQQELFSLEQIAGRVQVTEAEVLDSRYLGGETELKLRLLQADGLEIDAIYPQMVTPLPKRGEQVRVWFSADSVCFFKGES
ncbi:ABC transporter ATP-binding protein [Brevibacillus humidisoli]|uniref:ABC transporter ATP-binding protein n=1 Tax=Brevibacillus humidisoli TaxID=2895522 RepID=UPI001E538E58|nr:ABC transporter ATP-binding protein [Brevibacillus humidisoli]UFJ41844.1 ABC transporter ATP-binding protein [Brevibacillus humidisoli]